MLDHAGHLIGDFTVAGLGTDTYLGPDTYMIFGSGIAERYHQRWFDAQLAEFIASHDAADVRYVTHGPSLCGLSIAGPASRAVLASVVRDDTADMAFLDIRRAVVGMVPVIIGRISYTGDLGYELWCEPGYQQALYDTLMDAGQSHGIRLFGGRALDSLRLEKSFGAWASEYRPIYTPDEAGLGGFVQPDKGPFVGREAVLAARENGPSRRMISFTVQTEDADVIGDEPIWHDDKVVGWVTSGGYAHHAGVSVALGYVPTELSQTDDGFTIELLGTRRDATRLHQPLFDPDGSRMRA
jgi:dimethylglycine dehydrogenase